MDHPRLEKAAEEPIQNGANPAAEGSLITRNSPSIQRQGQLPLRTNVQTKLYKIGRILSLSSDSNLLELYWDSYLTSESVHLRGWFCIKHLEQRRPLYNDRSEYENALQGMLKREAAHQE